MKLLDAMREYKKGCSNDPNCEECERAFMDYLHKNHRITHQDNEPPYPPPSRKFKELLFGGAIEVHDKCANKLKKPFPWKFAIIWCFFCIGVILGGIQS